MASEIPEWVDRAEYPFVAHSFAAPAGRMHYVDEGEGETILFVHGTPDWSFGWRQLIKGLSPHYRCIAPDHLGFGLSEKPPADKWNYLPSDHSANLTAFIEALGLHDITLVLHDFGGPIGLGYAVECPQNVRRLVLMNTWCWSLAGEPHFDASRMLAGALGRFLYQQCAFSTRVMMPKSYGDRKRLKPHIHRHFLNALPTPAARYPTWVLAREILASSDWYQSLWERRKRLAAVPTLILWGMKDFAFRPQELARLQDGFPHAHTRTFDSAGHFLQEEEPEAVLAEFRSFLDT